MKYRFLCTIILIALSTPPVFATESVGTEEAQGMGIGAAIGGLVGGPPGLVIGAAIGSAIGHKQSKEKTITQLKQDIKNKNTEIKTIAKKIAALNSEHQQALQQVAIEKNNINHIQLSENLTFTIFFKTNQSEIEPQFDLALIKLVKLIKQHPDLNIRINAYADIRGSVEHNKRLSEKRAYAVQATLINNGFDSNRIQIHSFGEDPLTVNTEPESFIFDRRVDLEVTFLDEV